MSEIPTPSPIEQAAPVDGAPMGDMYDGGMLVLGMDSQPFISRKADERTAAIGGTAISREKVNDEYRRAFPAGGSDKTRFSSFADRTTKAEHNKL